MRPVNLIPPEERRGDRAPTRTGPIAYVLVGALALALAAVTAVVLTNNQIADREEQLAGLEVREAAARDRAEALASYAEFAALKEARVQTVDSLARSRFDWERVLRELALVIPDGVQLTGVTGTVVPGLSLESGTSSSLREGITGPALEVLGCAPDTEAVAEFAASLEDIDGVTRVGVNRSASTGQEAVGSASSAGGEAASCVSDRPVYQFEMVAAFDEVLVAAAAEIAGQAAADAAPASETPESGGSAEQQESRDSAAAQTGKASDAAGLVPGVAR